MIQISKKKPLPTSHAGDREPAQKSAQQAGQKPGPAASYKTRTRSAARASKADKAQADAALQALTQNQASMAHLVSLVPGIKLAIAAIIASVVIAALYFGKKLLLPLALAILLGFLLDPLVRKLRRWGLPRIAAVLLVVAVVLAGVGSLGTYVGSQLASLAESLPRYQSTMSEKLRDLRQSYEQPGMFERLKHMAAGLQEDISGNANTSHSSTGHHAHAGQSSTRASPPALQKVEIVQTQSSDMELARTWLLRVSEPVVMTGIVLLFVIFILLDRDGMRDRLLRLVGGNINTATDALEEAALRIGKYLRMQLIVNIIYGIPLATGLWLIGVPGALLWGVLAALLRYIPYLGAALAAMFPLALAFAVGHDWSMLLWTGTLIVTLELLSNNLIEPWLYGESTGLSTLAIIISATFWTALWGPIGLILATPLAVCLLVLGRSFPALGIFEVLLGSEPVLSPGQRLYQRLLAENVDAALELSEIVIRENLPNASSSEDEALAVVQYYDSVLLTSLRLSNHLHNTLATAEQRFRFDNGMDDLLDALSDEHPPAPGTIPPPHEIAPIHCIGARWEVDSMAAMAMTHGLRLYGHRTSHSTHALDARIDLDALPDMSQTVLLCLSIFNPQPQAQIRHIARRIRSRWPKMRIIASAWNTDSQLLNNDMARHLGVDGLVNSVHEIAIRAHLVFAQKTELTYTPAPLPANETRRLEALHASGALDPGHFALYRNLIWRASNAFNLRFAQVSLIDREWVYTPGTSFAVQDEESLDAGLPRAQSICAYVVRNAAPFVVEDTARDLRFTHNPSLTEHNVRFYAGVPLRTRKGDVIGALSLMDDQPHRAEDIDMDLLELMASDLMSELRRSARSRHGRHDSTSSTDSSTQPHPAPDPRRRLPLSHSRTHGHKPADPPESRTD